MVDEVRLEVLDDQHHLAWLKSWHRSIREIEAQAAGEPDPPQVEDILTGVHQLDKFKIIRIEGAVVAISLRVIHDLGNTQPGKQGEGLRVTVFLIGCFCHR